MRLMKWFHLFYMSSSGTKNKWPHKRLNLSKLRAHIYVHIKKQTGEHTHTSNDKKHWLHVRSGKRFHLIHFIYFRRIFDRCKKLSKRLLPIHFRNSLQCSYWKEKASMAFLPFLDFNLSRITTGSAWIIHVTLPSRLVVTPWINATWRWVGEGSGSGGNRTRVVTVMKSDYLPLHQIFLKKYLPNLKSVNLLKSILYKHWLGRVIGNQFE